MTFSPLAKKEFDPSTAITFDNDKFNELSLTDRLILFRKMAESGRLQTTVPILPLLFNLKGKPYTLRNHFPFESFFRTRKPKKILVIAARQLGKSVSLAADQVLTAASIPYFSILTVTPLFEQIRRFSSNYVGPFIQQSPVKSLLISTKTVDSVLQRTFINNSRLLYSFAYLDASRIRGTDALQVNYDEVQDLDRDHIPIIAETMSAAENWGISQFTGTPKTLDNTIYALRSESSQAEWFTKCPGCNYWNIASVDHDLLKMIGPFHEDISEEQPATICAKCSRRINPRTGRWVHRYPEKRWDFASYHIPQIIMPMHYADADKWSLLLGKQQGWGNTTIANFYNEVLGESYDVGTKLVSQTELQKAAVLNKNDEEEACKVVQRYDYKILAIDWGGGGEDGVSFTTLAVMGIQGDGQIDVIFGKRLLTPHDHLAEADECLRVYTKFNCHMIAHDYTGAGSIRETVLVHRGVPFENVLGIAYVRTAHTNIMSFVEATEKHSRRFWRVDKARSLQLTCHAIKLLKIRFFKYDYINTDNPGLLHDFLALIESKIPTNHAGDIYTIQRNPMFSDDFAQAVNIGACCLWHLTDSWPKLNQGTNFILNQQQATALGDYSNNDWDIGGFPM